MSGYDLAYKLLSPYFGYFIALFLLWIVLKISDESLGGLVKGTIAEIKDLLHIKPNNKSLNAAGVLLLFFLTIFLYHGGLKELLLPEQRDMPHDILFAAVLFFFGFVLLISIKLTKYSR